MSDLQKLKLRVKKVWKVLVEYNANPKNKLKQSQLEPKPIVQDDSIFGAIDDGIKSIISSIASVFKINIFYGVGLVCFLILAFFGSMALMQSIQNLLYGDQSQYDSSSSYSSIVPNSGSKQSSFLENSQRDYVPIPIGGSINNTLEDAKKSQLYYSSDILNEIGKYFYSTFDNFVFTTVDPTGFSRIEGDKVVLYNNIDYNARIDANNLLSSSMKYSNRLGFIGGGIIVFLIVISGVIMLTSSDNSRVIQGTFGQIVRLIKAVVIMFIAPFLLSISVVSINLINKEVLAFNNGYCSSRAIDPDSTENKTLAECAFEKVRVGFMNANEKTNIYTETKQLSKPPEAQIDWWDIGAYLQRFWNQFEALGTNIPTILLMLIILLLFMVIALQFVARFIQLYFLFALYPVVVCFWCHERTSSFGYSYIRQIATLLLQQPFFLLAFVIFQEVSLNLAGNMWNFSNLLIYAIFLGSLTVIPGSFAGRIFGDVGLFYANQNQNQNIYNKVMYKNQNQHRLEKPAKLAGKSLIKGIDTYKNFEDARSG